MKQEFVTREEYQALLERLEDLEDRLTAMTAPPIEDGLPHELAMRIVGGESPVRVWREHRGMTGAALAAEAGVGAGYLSEIEAGKKPGSVAALAKLAKALRLDVDDLVRRPAAPAGE